MKGKNIGEFEELVMLSVGALHEEAYAITIQKRLEAEAKRSVPLGAIYSALDRLTKKGLVKSWVGDPTPVRGGRRKRFFELTDDGIEALEESYQIREQMWRAALELNPRMREVVAESV